MVYCIKAGVFRKIIRPLGVKCLTSFISIVIFSLLIVSCDQKTSNYTAFCIKEMRIEEFHSADNISILLTTGGSFYLDLNNGIIEISQCIGVKRVLARVRLPLSYSKTLTGPRQNAFDVTWSSSTGAKIVISGDSVIRIWNIKELTVEVEFTPAHSVVKDDNSGLVTLDNDGGLVIIPPQESLNKDWPKTFINNVWKLRAKEPLSMLFIGVCPPRQFDWDRSFMPVIHYSSHIQRYPTDEQIIAWSHYAKILEMHSWVWQNRYDEDAKDADGNKLPFWYDYSWSAQEGKWIPDDEAEFRRVISTAHAHGMKVIPYVSGVEGIEMAEMQRLKRTFDIDGLYIDGLYPQQPELAYNAARDLRELFGEKGWLTLHNTRPSGYFFPFVTTYMDFVVTSEHEVLNRWTSTSYRISNAIASLWPEIPLGETNAEDFLRELIVDSLSYNNRVLLMAGEKGQWRDWRLYFTPEEMEFMLEYYLAALQRMRETGCKDYLPESLEEME